MTISYSIVFILSYLLSIYVNKYFHKVIGWLYNLTHKKAWRIVIIISITFIIIFSILSVVRFNLMVPNVYDIGNMEQGVWNTLHGRILRMTTYYPAETRLFAHVEPMLILITPLYALWQDPRTLLILQTIVVGIGALPLYLIVREKLKNSFIGLVFVFAYLMNPAIHQAVMTDFHTITFVPALFFFAYYFFFKNRTSLSFIFFMFILMCREESAALVGLFGLYVMLFQKKKFIFGSSLFIIGIGWVIFALFVIIPIFSPAGYPIQYHMYNKFGGSPVEMIKNFFHTPQLFINHFLQLGKISYVMYLLLPLSFISLFYPQLLLTGLFSFATIILSGGVLLSGRFQYHVAMVGPIFVSAIYGLYYLNKRNSRGNSLNRLIVAAIVFISILNFIFLQSTSLSINNNFIGRYSPDRIKSVKKAIRLIEQGSSLTVSYRLGAQVADRKNLYLIDTPMRLKTDYIFITRYSNNYCKGVGHIFKTCEATFDEYEEYFNEIKNSSSHKLIFQENDIYLFKKIKL